MDKWMHGGLDGRTVGLVDGTWMKGRREVRMEADRITKGYIRSNIQSGYFYRASSSPLLLKGAPATARILCRSFTPKRHRQLWVKDLPKVPTWRLERDSNLPPFGRKATNQPIYVC